MGSQFVDLDADGHLDYLSATFDGSPHVAYGSDEGFKTPEHLLDREGRRIIIDYLWDYDLEKHLVDDRSMGAAGERKERCISALAFDWDGDGDFDLLLGSYENGRLYLRRNEGTPTAPAFAALNEPVLAGDSQFAIPGKMTAPKLVDWDGDGDLDLLAGSFGEAADTPRAGAIYLSLNRGAPGAPRFAPPSPLIPAPTGVASAPERPTDGLYVDTADIDGDGDLDLVVGAYARWQPPGPELSAADKERVAELTAEYEALTLELRANATEMMQDVARATEGLEEGSDEWRARYAEIAKAQRELDKPLHAKLRAVREPLHELVPPPSRKSFIWWLERIASANPGTTASAAAPRQ